MCPLCARPPPFAEKILSQRARQRDVEKVFVYVGGGDRRAAARAGWFMKKL